jgi:hypothetical protein
MPEGLPAQFWDQSSGQVNMPDLVKSYGELSTFKTSHDERLAALPQKAEDYKVEWKAPDGFKPPEGLDPAALKINDKDPRIPALRAFAFEHKMSQDQVTALVGLHVQAQIAEFAEADAEIQAEMKALGENGKTRVTAAETFLKAAVSTEEYAALRPFIGNARAFAAIEKLIAKATAGGPPPNSNDGGNPPPKPQTRIADRFYGQKAS